MNRSIGQTGPTPPIKPEKAKQVKRKRRTSFEPQKWDGWDQDPDVQYERMRDEKYDQQNIKA
jgi:hypothetical protein